MPRSLENLVKDNYRSGRDNLGADFFAPCLDACDTYLRAVAYFSSSSLRNWSGALQRLLQSDEDPNIYLIISPSLSAEDKSALTQAIDPEQKEELLETLSDRVLADAALVESGSASRDRHLRLFQWLVAKERLRIRFAFPEHVDGATDYHEKYGVFVFPDNNRVAFSGSANETASGYTTNFEYIDVYRTWYPSERDRVSTKESQFWETWRNETPGLVVKSPSWEVLSRIRERAPEQRPGGERIADAGNSTTNEELWDHQGEAVERFIERGNGVLEMATGTGKTRTALAICRTLIGRGTIDSVVVSTEGNDLLEQWYKEVIPLSLEQGLSVTRQFGPHREAESFVVRPTKRLHITSRGFLPSLLAQLSEWQRRKVLLIHDEVHGLGSPQNRQELSRYRGTIGWHLGLSATPERAYDEEGNEFIEGFVGPVVFRFELEDAIRGGVLAPFTYRALEWVPSQEDRDRVAAVYRKRAARRHEGRPMSDEEVWRNIAAVYKESEQKLPILRELLRQEPRLLEGALIFVPTVEYGYKVANIVRDYTRAFRTYFADADPQALRRFSRGNLNTLIACHRLSQGIDVRSISTVILMSSDRAHLETIQRIGRCLRTNPQEPNKLAAVVDFVRVPGSSDAGEDAEENIPDTHRRRWLERASQVRQERG